MDKLKKVELRCLDELIPNKLMIRLDKAGVVTVEDLLSLDIDEFSNFEFVGAKTIEELLKLINLVQEEQDYVYSVYEKTSGIIDQATYDRLKDKKIDSLKYIIPPKLYKKLIDNGMIDVKSILDTSVTQFSTKPSIGRVIANLYDEFRRKLISKPDFICDIDQRYRDKKLPIRFKTDASGEYDYFLDIFKTIVDDYFALVKSQRSRHIVFYRFGIPSGKKYKLEDLAHYHGISSEYVRKIENKNVRKLKDLFNGEKITKPQCELHEIASRIIKKFFGGFEGKKILTRNELQKRIKTDYNKDLTSNDWAYLVFLFFIMGFKNDSIKENDFFIMDEEINIRTFKDVANTTYSILEKRVRPVSILDLVIDTKKALGKKDINNSFVEYAINIIDQIEIIQKDSDLFVQLKFEYLSSLSDMAYRILYEKQSKIDVKEITRKIMHKLSKTPHYRDKRPRSVTCQLSQDDRFIPIGKSGWALKEWEKESNLNTETIISLIKRAMRFLNKPSSLLEIKQQVSNYRVEINPNSILFYLNDRKGPFIKVKGSRYILNEWRNSYQNLIMNGSNRREPIRKDEFRSIIADVFRESEFRELTTNELKHAIQNKINIGDSSLVNRLPSVNILLMERRGTRNYYRIKENFEEILKNKNRKKSDLIEEKIIELLKQSENNTILFEKLVKILESEYGFAVGTIYYVIQRNQFFKKIKNEEGKNCVTLFENFKNLTADTPKKDEIDSIILGGENDKVEFKSSLRWSYKANRVDKQLEFVTAKTISGFLNSKGGILLIGVRDDGKILGLENDYKSLNKKNKDGFKLKLTEIVNNYIGKEFLGFLLVRIVKKNAKDICVVNIERSDKPSYVKQGSEDNFFIRGVAGTEKLDARQVVRYISTTWK